MRIANAIQLMGKCRETLKAFMDDIFGRRVVEDVNKKRDNMVRQCGNYASYFS